MVSVTDVPAGYREIAADLGERIVSGEWRPGDELPTQTDLASHYDTTPETIKGALSLLNTRDQLVLSRKGQRSVVREFRTITRVARYRPGRAALAADASDADVEFESVVTDTGIKRASDTVAVGLAISPGTEVFYRARRISVSGNVSQIAISYYPLDIFDKVPELEHHSAIEGGSHALFEKRDYPLTTFRERILFRPAQRSEARELELHVDSHVTSFTRTVTSGGRPIEFLDSVNAATLYAFAYTYGRESPLNEPSPAASAGRMGVGAE